MGLDTTHNAWHGPYSSFNDWRGWVGKQIGIELRQMEGFGGEISFDTVTHDVKALLDHSDCDGSLTPEQCEQIANGLDEILSKLPEDEPKDERSNYWLAERFRDGCRLAASKGETLEFR